MSEWKSTTLSEIAEFSQGIQVDIDQQFNLMTEGRVRFIRIVDFTKGSKDDIRYIMNPGERYQVEPDDLVMIRYGSQTAGKIARGFKGVIANNTFKITPKSNSQTNKNYLYYFLTQNEVYEFFKLMNASSTMPAITFGMAGSLDILLPPLLEQESIAEVLSSLDDKIDLLHRNNNTLEQLAETLFRQWFLENDDQENGKLGNIIDIFDNKRVPLSSTYREKMKTGILYPYYGAATIMDYVNDYIFDDDYLLLGEDGTVQTEEGYPVLQRALGKCWINNHTHVIKGISPYNNNFLYILLKNTSISHIVTGAVQPKINQGNLKDLEVVIPPKEAVKNYCEIIDPLFDKYFKNIVQIQKLETLRDTLLPKLMSGVVRVQN